MSSSPVSKQWAFKSQNSKRLEGSSSSLQFPPSKQKLEKNQKNSKNIQKTFKNNKIYHQTMEYTQKNINQSKNNNLKTKNHILL